MNVLLYISGLLGLALGGQVTKQQAVQQPHGYHGYGHGHGYGHRYGYGYGKVFGFPGSDPRCHEDGDIVMDPDNRCQVYQCILKQKKHGHDDKHIYKYFDVKLIRCPSAKLPAHVYPPRPTHDQHGNTHGYTGYGHNHGYGYKVHEVEVQTAITKYNHAHYLATHVKGAVGAVCGDYAYKPYTECKDVQRH